jgi:hypothetical protein
MNRNILDLKPTNLPVYVYHLEADIVALVHQKIAYKLKGYSFSRISVRANQPLKAGDVVSNHCCYYGHQKAEIIPQMCKKKVLGGVEKELQHYYGCQINRMAISYVDDDSIGNSCGVGSCTVFIGLPANSHNLEYWKKRIPDWDTRLECIGEVPSDLIY